MARFVDIELLPHERVALLQWNYTPELRSQLEAVSSDEVVTARISMTTLRWVTSDLNHAIVKQGCRDEDVFDLSERLEYVEATEDGSLAAWYE